jgi:hypothetical protein
MQSLKQEIEALEKEIADIEKGRRLILVLSNDRAKVAAFLSLVETNGRAAILDFLKRESSSQDAEVRDAKATTTPTKGQTVVFRIGNLTHCLSTNLQCSGKTYSLTK